MQLIKQIFPILAYSGALMVFLIFTDPRKLPAVLLIVPFVLLFLLILAFAQAIVRLQHRGAVLSEKTTGTALIIAGVPTLLLVLSSISQLTWRDSLLAVIFGIGLVIYLRRANFLGNR